MRSAKQGNYLKAPETPLYKLSLLQVPFPYTLALLRANNTGVYLSFILKEFDDILLQNSLPVQPLLTRETAHVGYNYGPRAKTDELGMRI